MKKRKHKAKLTKRVFGNDHGSKTTHAGVTSREEAERIAKAELELQAHFKHHGIAKPAKVPKPHAPTLAEQLPPGVYFDDGRRTALVYQVGRVHVHFITMRNGVIEREHLDGAHFTRVFTGRWPAYPLRRAARLYLASSLTKTETALRQLNAMAAA